MKLCRRTLLVFLTVFWVLAAGTTPVFAAYVDNKNGTVTDGNTNLVWQKAEDGVARTWAGATGYCENLVLGGYSDWRLPRVDELSTIVDYSRYPTIDPTFAPLQGIDFWSSSPMAIDPTRRAWLVGFYDGTVYTYFQSSIYYTRCVRGGPFWSFDPVGHLVVAGQNTVRDTYRNNMWQRQDDQLYRTWTSAQSYCANLSLDGYTDWRLPSASELQTIIDYTAYSPALSTEVFSITVSNVFWSSTGSARYPAGTFAVWVDFDGGSSGLINSGDSKYVRCIRAGSVPPPASYSISGTVKTSSGSAIAGTTLVLSGASSATTSSDANGNYAFTVTSNGAYTVTPSKAGYTFSPQSRSITISGASVSGQDFTGTGQTGSLTVVIAPAGAVSAGAQWQVDGGALQNSGATVTGLTAGSHTLAFKNVSGWNTPAAKTVTISSGVTTSDSGTYVQQTGSLTVAIAPAGAVSAGAQWQVDGGALQNSGATVTGLTAGSHTLAFKNVSGWNTPAAKTVTISSGVTTSDSGTYVQQTGSLTVAIAPAGAVSAGAQWQVDGGSLQNSGATLSGLTVGSHTLAFKSVSGWNTPAAKTVTISSGVTTSDSGTYVQQTGSLTVAITPAGAVSGGAQWQVDGGSWQNSGATSSGLAVGSHTLSFKSVSGWNTPAAKTVTINSGVTTSDSGVYTQTNHAPVASNSAFTTLQDSPVSGRLTATDSDGNALQYQIVVAAQKGVVTLNSLTGSFTYTPNHNITGTDTFTFKANDGTVDSNVASVGLTINPYSSISLEAEQGTLVTPMTPGSDPKATGGAFVWVPKSTANSLQTAGIGGQAIYSFNVSTPGNYVMWGRVMASGANHSSFFVSMDYGQYLTWHVALGPRGTWVWDEVRDNHAATPFTFYLGAGTHCLILDQMEDGTKIDSIVITTHPKWIPETVYSDAEDGTIDGWDVFDASPAGALITNLYDDVRDSYVIQTAGSGTTNGYRLRTAALKNWANCSQFILEWNMKYSECYVITVQLQTSVGLWTLQYEALDSDLLGSKALTRFGLGSDTKDGQWHTFVRDLQADLTRGQRGAKLLKVNSFSIRGSGRVDDIKLRQQP